MRELRIWKLDPGPLPVKEGRVAFELDVEDFVADVDASNPGNYGDLPGLLLRAEGLLSCVDRLHEGDYPPLSVVVPLCEAASTLLALGHIAGFIDNTWHEGADADEARFDEIGEEDWKGGVW